MAKSIVVYSALLAAIPTVPQLGKGQNQCHLHHGGRLLGRHLDQHRVLRQARVMKASQQCFAAVRTLLAGGLQRRAQFNLVGRNLALAHGSTLSPALEGYI